MPPVDIEKLKEIMGNDRELIQECFADFLIDYPGIIADLKAAVTEMDFYKLDTAAHKLKGSLKYLAAGKAAKAALAVETAGRDQDFDSIGGKIANLETECRKLILFMDEFPG